MKTAEEMAGIIYAMIFSDPPASHDAMVEELEKFKLDAGKVGMTKAAQHGKLCCEVSSNLSVARQGERVSKHILRMRDNLKPEDMK